MNARKGNEAAVENGDKGEHAEVHAIDDITNNLFDCSAIVGTLRDGLFESVEDDNIVPYSATDLCGVLGVLKDRIKDAEKALKVLDEARMERRDGKPQKERAA